MRTLYPNAGYTLLDRLKETVDGKNMTKIIQVMNYYGVADFFADWRAVEASHGLKHQVVRTVDLPASTRQALDSGVAPNVTHTQTVWEDDLDLPGSRVPPSRKRIDSSAVPW